MKLAYNVRFAFSGGLLAVLMTATPVASANFDNTLDGVFESMMSNTTDPGTYSTMRRGVLSGGRVSARTNISKANLGYLDMPSFSAGCGGIDIFGGSFSFINKDQLVQLARHTVQNAAGLLFQQALAYMSPKIAEGMSQFTQKVQMMNDTMLDSCAMAKGIVATIPGTDTGSASNMADLWSSGKGFADDMFDSFSSTGSDNSSKKMAESDDDEAKALVFGNPLWDVMKETSVSSVYGSDKDSFREEILSLTGFVVYDSENLDQDGNPQPKYAPPLVTITQLIEGGTVETYDCQNDGCTKFKAKDTKIDGLASRLRNRMLGADGEVGLIKSIRFNDTGSVSAGSILGSFPLGVGANLVNLIDRSQLAAEGFVNENAPTLALGTIYELTRNMMQVADTSLAKSQNVYREAVKEQLRDSRRLLTDQYEAATDQYGTIANLRERSGSLLSKTRTVYENQFLRRNQTE